MCSQLDAAQHDGALCSRFMRLVCTVYSQLVVVQCQRAYWSSVHVVKVYTSYPQHACTVYSFTDACCRDDLEQVRILADQCRRREKLRKRALSTWQQQMQSLLQHAVTLDQQLLHPTPPSASPKQLSPSKALASQSSHKKQPNGKPGHSRGAGSKQALQLAAEIADATENAQAKFEHDMALSLQLTKGVADQAVKLHHVKIVRADSGQPGTSADVAEPSEEPAQTDEVLGHVSVCSSVCLYVCLSVCQSITHEHHSC